MIQISQKPANNNSKINNNKYEKTDTRKSQTNSMSVYTQSHRRNFSLLNPNFNRNTSIPRLKSSTNRSSQKIQINPQTQNSNDYFWLLIAAKQYYHKTSNLVAAIANFEQFLSHSPGHQQALYLCAVCYMNTDEPLKAIQKLKQYLAISAKSKPVAQTPTRKLIIAQSQIQTLPNYSHVCLLLSMAYNKTNNLEKSLETVNQALKFDGKYEQALCFRAKLYIKMANRVNEKGYEKIDKSNNDANKLRQKAYFDYKSVIRNNQKCWDAWIGLGDYHMEVYAYRQALKSYQKVKEGMEKYKEPQIEIEQNATYVEPEKYNFQNVKAQGNGQKLDASLKKQKARTYSQIVPDHEQSSDNQLFKAKQKLTLTNITSPTNKTGIKAKFFQSQRQSHSRPKPNLNLNVNFNVNVNLNVNLNQPNSRNKITTVTIPKQTSRIQNPSQPSPHQLQLKICICLYFLCEYQKSIQNLQQLLHSKAVGCYSQIYFYLGLNQFKIYQQMQAQGYSSKFSSNKKQSLELHHRNIAPMQVLLSNPLQKPNADQFKTTSIKNKHQSSPAELLQQSILNFESCISANNNKKVMVKACKMLIKLYIQNSQFYQTESIVKLAQKYKIDNELKQYKTLSEVTMLVIKQKYEQALPILKRLYNQITSNNNNGIKPKVEQSNRKKDNSKQKQKQQFLSLRGSQKNKSNSYNHKLKRNSMVNQDANQFNNSQLYVEQQQQVEEHQHLIHTTTGPQKMSITEQYQNNDDAAEQIGSNQFKNLTIKNRLDPPALSTPLQKSTHPIRPSISHPSHSSSPQQLQWMLPLILLFRAYSDYFSDNFIECLETYEHYENYIKDYLGKQPQSDIYLSYNKVMCQAILMLDNEMIEQALQKFMTAVQNCYRLTKTVAVEPILFRILGMIRIAISDSPILNEEVNTRTKIFQLIPQILNHYMAAISSNCLVHYYYSLALYQLQRYKEASQQLEKCLKQAEECTWKFLHAKGVIEIHNKLYKEAVRQFSAGLLVQEKADLYLGRCVCYIYLFEANDGENNLLMEKSFEDLQKFIEIQQNKDKISKWVTKILFFNKAYEEVTKSLKKVSNYILESDQDLIKIQKCLNIYNGIFEDGGVLGQVLINAFQGKYEQNSIEINNQRHQIVLSDFVHSKYKKWLKILSLYSSERYSQLIKFLQLTIFEEKNEQELAELRYNLAMVYYLSSDLHKADNVLASLVKSYPDLANRIEKFINREYEEDECVDDLQKQLKGIKRLSSFLPYRKTNLSSKILASSIGIYIKISIPFPPFFKPNIDLVLDDSFMYGETAQSCIPKKIEAPWIKKIVGNVQFTDNIIESLNTSVFDHDVLSAKESKQDLQSSSLDLVDSELKNF